MLSPEAAITMDPPETRYQLVVTCIDALKSGAEIQRAQFRTRESFTAAELSDPDFRVTCRICEQQHALLNPEEVLDRKALGYMSIPLGYGMLTAVLGGTAGRTPSTDPPLIPRRNIVRLNPEEEARRRALGRVPVFAPKVGRNAPCPCGSGKKSKKCHGAPGGGL